MNLDVTMSGALLAGLISFLSPCVLPLVPPFLCFITGATLEELTTHERGTAAAIKLQALSSSLLFVAGFSTVFILLGLGASSIGQALRFYSQYFNIIAGIFTILMGCKFLGLFNINILNREVRYHPQRRPLGPIGIYGTGVAFALGWTPCLGPVLAAILTIASNQPDLAKGAWLLAAYSFGLGIPFILAGTALGGFIGFYKKFRHALPLIEKIMGVLLVITGLLFLTSSIQGFGIWIIELFPQLGTLG